MRRITLLLAVLFVCFAFSSCATILSSDTETVAFVTDPKGATVSIDGINLGVTPVALNLSTESPHIVQIEKDGYNPVTVQLEKKIKWGWQILDLVTTGFIGNAVDLVTGYGYSLEPNQVSLKLVPKN